MNPASVIALFCDDIREEKSGALTLVGVLTDNANVPPPPTSPGEDRTYIRMIPRLSIYVRINFDVSAELGPISVKLIMPDGTVLHDEPIEESVVARARATREKGNPIGGLIQRLQFGGIPLTQLGRMRVEVTIGAETYLAGFLNFISEDETASA